MSTKFFLVIVFTIILKVKLLKHDLTKIVPKINTLWLIFSIFIIKSM